MKNVVSRDLKKGMVLTRANKHLKIKELVRTGRSCTAVVVNEKGKEEKLTITDMWNQKVYILNPEKKVPEMAKKLKPVVAKPAKKEPAKKAAGVKPKVTEIKRANGIATLYHRKDGSVMCSSWVRTS